MKKIVFLVLMSNFFINAWAQTQYVTTIHPFAEILRTVIGERGQVIRTLPPGASPHTYDLRPSDLRAVQNAVAVFYGSAHLDGWAVRFQTKSKVMLMELVPESARLPFPTEVHDPDHADEHYDPHFWTDPLAVKATLPGLVDVLSRLDPSGKAIFQANAKNFAAQLDTLHQQLDQMLAPIQNRVVVLSHPFFCYFLTRYGFTVADYIEPLPGKEPTPKALLALRQKIQKQKIRAIFTAPQDSQRPSQIVAESAGIQVFILDPIGGVAGKMSYSEILTSCARVLVQALQ